jgi:hypothetical protein
MDDIRKGVCPLCQHNEVIETPVKLPGGGELWVIPFQPAIFSASPSPPYGRAMLYICRRCGHFQAAIAKPDAIPIRAELGTRLIEGPKPQGPYR